MLGLLQDKNAIYLFTAYGVFLGGVAVYLISLWLRRRNLDRDEQIIEQIEEEERQRSFSSHVEETAIKETTQSRAVEEGAAER